MSAQWRSATAVLASALVASAAAIRAKGTDWTQRWRAWQAADAEIMTDGEASATRPFAPADFRRPKQ